MKRCILLFSLFFVFSVGSLTAAGSPDKPVKADRQIIDGTLENGLHYIIKPYPWPESTVNLRLIVDVGSVDEEDHEQGLAHFVEHMAFNGTRSFAKNDLIAWLQSLGVGFGPDLNAWTSFDHTVYRVQIPLFEEDALETGMTVMEEWAFHLSLTDKDIEEERGIILEEWRTRLSGQAALYEMVAPLILSGSRYAERLPIGRMDVVTGCEPEALRTFYHKWYTPDRMTLIVTGAVNGLEIEKQIIERFSGYTPAQLPVPDREAVVLNSQPRYKHFPDAEVSSGVLYINTVKEREPLVTVEDFRDEVLLKLYRYMLSKRLDYRRRNDPDTPFISSDVYYYQITRDLLLFRMKIEHSPEKALAAYTAAMEELERIKLFGFTEVELSQAKDIVLGEEKRLFDERNYQANSYFAWTITQNELYGRVNVSIADEYRLYKRLIASITLDDLSEFYGYHLDGPGRSVADITPEGTDIALSEQDFIRAGEMALGAELTPMDDIVIDDGILSMKPRPGRIIEKKYHKDTDIHEWTLSNGVRVLIKQTNLQNNNIQFAAYSPGGEWTVESEDLFSCRIAVPLALESGAGEKTREDFEAFMSNKDLGMSFHINRFTEEIWGYSSKKDFESLLQLINVSMSSPRRDPEVAESFMSRLSDQISNRYADPLNLFFDRRILALFGGHERARGLNPETLSLVDTDKAYDILNKKINNASDFTFMFVGSIDPVLNEKDILTYIGGLPSSGETETNVETDMDFVHGGAVEIVYAGKNPKSVVNMQWLADFSWNYQDSYTLFVLSHALKNHLQDRLREDKSGTYGLHMGAETFSSPLEKMDLFLQFECDPDRVDELVQVVYDELDAFRQGQIDDDLIQTVIAQRKEWLRQGHLSNQGWLWDMMYLDKNNLDFSIAANLEEDYIEKINKESLVSFINTYIHDSECVLSILYPESYE